MIYFRSIEGDEMWDGTKIEKSKYPKTGEVTVYYGGFVIEDLGENRQRVSGCVLFNHNMGPKCPAWLLPYVIKTAAVVFNNMYAKRARTIPQSNQDLIKEKTLFYDNIREKIRKNNRDERVRKNP